MRLWRNWNLHSVSNSCTGGSIFPFLDQIELPQPTHAHMRGSLSALPGNTPTIGPTPWERKVVFCTLIWDLGEEKQSGEANTLQGFVWQQVQVEGVPRQGWHPVFSSATWRSPCWCRWSWGTARWDQPECTDFEALCSFCPWPLLNQLPNVLALELEVDGSLKFAHKPIIRN